MTINFDTDAHVEVTPYPGARLYLSKAEVDEYNRNPDLFIALDAGFDTVEQFHEFMEAQGMPLCGARTVKGEYCKNAADCAVDPAEWRALHRNMSCGFHQWVEQGAAA